MLDRCKKKKVLFLDIVDTWEELVTTLKETLVAVCIVIKELAFSLI